MDYDLLFDHSPFAVIIIDCNDNTVIYENNQTVSLLKRHYKAETSVSDAFGEIIDKLKLNVSDKEPSIELANGIALSFSGKLIENSNTLIIYITEIESTETLLYKKLTSTRNFMQEIYNCINSSEETDERINNALAMVGLYTNVSRVCVFELSADETHIMNNYEWCAENVSSQIENLQNVSLEISNWHNVVTSPDKVTLYAANKLGGEARAFLDKYHIKSMAIVPIYNHNKAIGTISFVDCDDYRVWTQQELYALREIAFAIAILVIIKQAEDSARRTFDIMRSVLDNLKANVYVSDPQTYELLFVNKTLMKLLGKTNSNELEGQKCWAVLQKDQTEPCSFCPINKLYENEKANITGSIKSEFKNTVNGLWYYIEDSFMDWIDGRRVHLESNMEITEQKQHEEKLEYYASRDSLTGLYNREWGYKILMKELERMVADDTVLSVCFMDVDGLKAVNDHYGHERGDELLKSVVETILQHIRTADTLFRWAGDEFVLILPKCSVKQAQVIVDKIETAFDKINKSKVFVFDMSISTGIEDVCIENMINYEELIANADKKMYEQKIKKRKGR